MSISVTIRDALLRHVMQAVGSALVTGGIITASQADSLTPIGVAILGAAISGIAAWWAGRGGTEKSILTAAVNLPSVAKDQTTIVVTDPKLAQQMPSEVVYGQDMSIQ